MDEAIDINNHTLPPVPHIVDSDNVFRQAHWSSLIGKKNHRYPSESHFKPDVDGLSVYLESIIQKVEEVYITIGLSYKTGKTEYKTPQDFKVFCLGVKALRQISGIKDVIHSPSINGNPAPVGFPNIYSHSLVLYPDDEEIRMEISDYCNSNYDSIYCECDVKSFNQKIDELRERLDNTPYHRY